MLKLDSSGAYQWHTFYGSSSEDHAYAIAAVGSATVYVVGWSGGTWNGPAGQSPLHGLSGACCNIFVLKLDSSGSYQWHTFYGGATGYGYGIAQDGRGNVYVTGWSARTWNGPAGQSPLHAHSSASGTWDIFVLKLNANGTYQWHTFYGSNGSTDVGDGIAVDGSGNVYVTGDSGETWNGPAGQNPLNAYNGGIFILKLDSSGAYQWHTFYGSYSSDRGSGIAADGSGNVYVTGVSLATWNGPAEQDPLHAFSGTEDIFVLKLSEATEATTTPCDFNGDGKTDILWRNKSTGQNIVWFMNGVTYSSYVELLQVADTNWQILGTGDFNGDGKTDILWRNKSTGQNIVWFMNGVTYSSYAELLQVADTNWQIVGTGDFNGDGKTDILWRNKSTGQNVVWFMNGTTYSSYAELLQVTDTNWQIVGTGDFNGDGKTDIVWRNKSTGQNVVWFMNGTTYSSYAEIMQVTDTNWQIVGTGDFNSDGKVDILWRNKSTGQNVVWLMNGTAYNSYTWLPDVPDTNWEIVGPK